MDININTVAATVISCTSRKQKQLITELIQEHSYSEFELITLLPSILPSPIESGVSIAEQQTFITALAHTLCIQQQAESANQDELAEAQILIHTVNANFKKPRKAEKDLYCRAVKTNLTEREYQNLLEVMASYHYKSASQFLRDVITQQLTVKPQQGPEITQYFQSTKHIAEALDSLIEEGNPLHNNALTEQFSAALQKLQQTLQTTRNLAIDSHNAQTAKLLATKYLDSNTLRELYRSKLELEDTEL
ncbi:chromosome segregation ATPase [Vibrio splendidus]|uniref:chromosome segregation ATPase n=1 Tax=Vibrio splendidus TaxID=29497 RepID=UPI000C8184CF|nr:chromosome segregation ATPase [Vibrio splendidus]PMI54250.1 chromosome segregation ATPase [Vibrio splendidus]